MNGILFIDLHTMKASHTEIEGGEAYVSVKKAAEQEMELDYAAETLLGFAEKGTCDRMRGDRYKQMFITTMLFAVVIVLNYIIGEGNVVVSIVAFMVWVVVNAVINLHYVVNKGSVLLARQVKGSREEMVKAMRESFKNGVHRKADKGN